LLVGDVLAHRLGPRKIEGAVRKRQRQRVAAHDLHAVGQAGAAGQQFRGPTEARGRVQGRDMCAVAGSQEAGRTANPGADIEHPVIRLRARELGEG